jgi:hypothetical protein
MSRTASELQSRESLIYLSRLLLSCKSARSDGSSAETPLEPPVSLGRDGERENFLALAQSHHVVVRALEALLELERDRRTALPVSWVEDALAAERARIGNALHFLDRICAAFHERGYDVTVMKTLDHWPDFGSDLDLYTTASPADIARLMEGRFGANLQHRSWGDCLANKWNFSVPDLPEAVEIHVSRLGQTGEQVGIAATLASRAGQVSIGGYQFPVPSIPDRLMISTLQRMYRHFNFRLCDIIDTLEVGDADRIDYQLLRLLANDAGIWEGVATYLKVVSDYAATYRGSGLDLPQFVSVAGQFGGETLYYSKGYLRVPIMPHSVWLYGSELAHVLSRGEIHNGVRLSLLPQLGTAAAAKQKLTGSNHGIW